VKRITAVIFVVILGLFTAVVGSPAQPADAKKSYDVAFTDIMLESRGTEIPATVVVPVGKAHERFPLVVIHHGHGGGRHENGGLVRVADALAKAGIMSIRVDFAGAGDSAEPFTKLTYTTMLADSNAALLYAVRNLPVQKNRIGGFGYSEGSAVVAMQAGQPFTPYKAVALLGPVADPAGVFQHSMGEDQFWTYYAEAQANGYAEITTVWGQIQNSSLEWFDETLQVDPVGDIEYFKGRALVLWGEAEQTIPFGEAEAYMAATEDSAKSNKLVTIPDADHGYGFYSDQPDVDAVLHQALVNFFKKALK
jgi:alpha/beta superfamily hydrolase